MICYVLTHPSDWSQVSVIFWYLDFYASCFPSVSESNTTQHHNKAFHIIIIITIIISSHLSSRKKNCAGGRKRETRGCCLIIIIFPTTTTHFYFSWWTKPNSKRQHVIYIKRSDSPVVLHKHVSTLVREKNKHQVKMNTFFVLKYARITTLSYITFVAIQNERKSWVGSLF